MVGPKGGNQSNPYLGNIINPEGDLGGEYHWPWTQFPYSEYSGHFCLGIIYSRVDFSAIDETEVIVVKELTGDYFNKQTIGERQVTKIEKLRSITSVIKDFIFFACEKWELASDRRGSGNTANI
jgi:hypothetical protein